MSCLGSTAAAVQPNGLWNIPNPSQPNPGPRGDGSPCNISTLEEHWLSQKSKIHRETWAFTTINFAEEILFSWQSWRSGRTRCRTAWRISGPDCGWRHPKRYLPTCSGTTCGWSSSWLVLALVSLHCNAFVKPKRVCANSIRCRPGSNAGVAGLGQTNQSDAAWLELLARLGTSLWGWEFWVVNLRIMFKEI